jgi:hypothetical protein
MGRIEQVLDVLGIACAAAINGAGIMVPAQVYQGFPTGPELTTILSQNQYAVSLFPLPGGRRLPPRGKDAVAKTTLVPPTVTSSISTVFMPDGITTQITFAGVLHTYNFYVIFRHPTLGTLSAYYQSQESDTLVSLAARISDALNAYPDPSVLIYALGPTVVIYGLTLVHCNIGTTGTVTQFQSRYEQRIQVSIWTPSAYQNTGVPDVDTPVSLRAAVVDAIINNVGTDMNMWYALPDTTSVRLRLSAMPFPKDESQSDYNVYESHMVFLAEYVLQSVVSATQVGVIDGTTTVGTFSPILTIGG